MHAMNWKNLREAYERRDVQYLIDALKDTDIANRRRAARFLGQLRDPDAVPALLRCLDAKDDHLRMTTLWALSKIGDERAIPRLMEVATSDPSLGPSSRATDVLAQLGDPRAVAQFVSLLVETDHHLDNGRYLTHSPPDLSIGRQRRRTIKRWIQKWSARRLVELNAAETIPALEEAARSANLRERVRLRRTIRKLRRTPT